MILLYQHLDIENTELFDLIPSDYAIEITLAQIAFYWHIVDMGSIALSIISVSEK